MGYGKRGATIDTFWPDDTETTLYVSSDNFIVMIDLLEKISEKWPGAAIADMRISAERIHTDCLYYDLYDPCDYTDFIVIEYTKGSEND